MNRIFIVSFLAVLLSGCATYKFNHGKGEYEKGYVASRDDYTIIEYTVGNNNSVPEDLKLAQERFQRRKDIVEDYYKKMGLIENRFRQMFVNPPKMVFAVVTGPFRLPFAAVADHKYEHNPDYREMVKKKEKELDEKKEKLVKELRDSLNKYIQKDLKAEQLVYNKYGLDVDSSSAEEGQQKKEKPEPQEEVKTAQEKRVEAVDSKTQETEEVPEGKTGIDEPVEQAREEIVVEQVPVEQEAAISQMGTGAVSEPETTVEPEAAMKPEAATGTETVPEPEAAAEPPVKAAEPEAAIKQEAAAEIKAVPEPEAAAEPQVKTAVEPEAKDGVEDSADISGPRAYIMAKPIRGFSPLKVHFYGSKSFSPGGRIVEYLWDFGDGDTSKKVSPVNTFYSSNFEPKQFNVTLTVTDNKGKVSSASTVIEVLNK